jgi:V8-like Glu-specific endopeptidase
MPNQLVQFTSNSGVPNTANSPVPLSPDEALAIFSATSLSPDIINPTPTIPTFHATPMSVRPLPVISRTPNLEEGILGVNALLPPIDNISFKPVNLYSFNETNSVRDSTFLRNLDSRQACDPQPYCCPDPRRLLEDTDYPWSTIGRVQAQDPTDPQKHVFCTGTLVGRRLVLTASHCVNCKCYADVLYRYCNE